MEPQKGLLPMHVSSKPISLKSGSTGGVEIASMPKNTAAPAKM